MGITIKKITFNVNGRELEFTFIDGEAMISGDDEAFNSLSINELRVLKKESLNLFLREFGYIKKPIGPDKSGPIGFFIYPNS